MLYNVWLPALTRLKNTPGIPQNGKGEGGCAPVSSNCIVKGDVKLGKDVHVSEFVILGEPSSKTEGLGPLTIGDNSTIRSHTVIYAGNHIGKKFQTGHHVLIRENNKIGDNVSVGSGSDIGRENIIGSGVRIHSSCFIPEFITIKDKAWLGPGVTILNVLHPPCPKFEECAKGTVIGEGAKIGGNVTIRPRVKIGKGAMIGSGAVVTRDIPDNALAYGNPARVTKDIKQMKCVLGAFNFPYEWEHKPQQGH